MAKKKEVLTNRRKDYVSAFIFATLTIMMMDGIWLGIIQRDAWASQIIRIQGKSHPMELRAWSAFISYLFVLIGILVLAIPRVRRPPSPSLQRVVHNDDEQSEECFLRGLCGDALFWGSIVGLVIYGVYDFTNLATLKQFTVVTAVSDFCWGIVLCATTTLVASLAATYVPIVVSQ